MRRVFILFILIFIFSSTLFLGGAFIASGEPIEELEKQIEENEKILEELRRETQEQEKNLHETQDYANSLAGQIENFKQQIRSLSGKINVKSQEIYTLQLAVQRLELQIQKLQDEAETTKSKMAVLLREIYKNDSESIIELLFKYESFSTFYNQVQARDSLSDAMVIRLENLKNIKQDLEKNQELINQEKTKLQKDQKIYRGQKIILDNQKIKQNQLLGQTKQQENLYQELLIDIQEKEQAIKREVFELEEQLRLTLDPSSVPRSYPGLFIWRTEGLLTQRYGCLYTNFAKRFYPACEGGAGGFHNGVDIASGLGTPIIVVNDGKVIAMASAPYAYGYWLAVEHSNGLVTLYTHMSSVRPVTSGRQVSRGDIVGYMGSSGFSTGSHLHFIVFAPDTFTVKPSRISGLLPIGATLNPFTYLP